LLKQGREHYGMQSFDQHLTYLYSAGTISLEVALAASTAPADFKRALTFQ
jgi:twitching motility protein PilT